MDNLKNTDREVESKSTNQDKKEILITLKNSDFGNKLYHIYQFVELFMDKKLVINYKTDTSLDAIMNRTISIELQEKDSVN
jgi:hypothetical protein